MLHSIILDPDGTLIDSRATNLNAFSKAPYDSAGYRASEVFAGIPELLAALPATGSHGFLATTRRTTRTRLTQEHLRSENGFEAVYARDCLTPQLPDKSTMFARGIAEQAQNAQKTIDVGETPENQAAGTPHFAMPRRLLAHRAR